jgi:hypothetical protein
MRYILTYFIFNSDINAHFRVTEPKWRDACPLDHVAHITFILKTTKLFSYVL